MKARDVLGRSLYGPDWNGLPDSYTVEDQVAALLAQTPAGEGVYIAPDGTLMRVRQQYCRPIEEATE